MVCISAATRLRVLANLLDDSADLAICVSLCPRMSDQRNTTGLLKLAAERGLRAMLFPGSGLAFDAQGASAPDDDAANVWHAGNAQVDLHARWEHGQSALLTPCDGNAGNSSHDVFDPGTGKTHADLLAIMEATAATHFASSPRFALTSVLAVDPARPRSMPPR